MCMAGGGGMHAWQGACMTGRVCMEEGGMCGRGHGMHAPSRYHEIWSMSGWYASYRDAFLFGIIF